MLFSLGKWAWAHACSKGDTRHLYYTPFFGQMQVRAVPLFWVIVGISLSWSKPADSVASGVGIGVGPTLINRVCHF